MALSHLLLPLVALTAIAATSHGQATFYATKCYPPPTPTADGGSAFRRSLLDLLGALPSAAAPTGYASLHTTGTGHALVRGLCFGESAPKPCHRCLSDAGEKITAQCGDASRHAGFWDERCFLGYADGANGSSSARADDMGVVIYFSGDVIPSPDTTTPACKGDATTGNRTVRVLAQCAGDQAAADCVGCLREASLSMATSWGSYAVEGRVGAVLGSKCYLRFEVSTPPLSLGEKIRKLIKDNIVLLVCAAVVIVVVVSWAW